MTTKQTTFHSIESSQIFICDFNDSFTYNLYSDFQNLGFNAKVISFKDTKFWSQLLKRKEKFILVLGPGPGDPKNYDFTLFAKFLDLENCFVFGVCLGHQLTLSYLGARVIESSNKLHGQVVKILDHNQDFFFDNKAHTYQRYNSLTVDIKNIKLKDCKYIFDSNNELMLFKSNRLLTCQFHPESVGTNCPKSLYYMVTQFLL